MTKLFTSKVKNLAISPRKLRLVADLVRGREVETALDLLKLSTKKGAPIVGKALNAALASARGQGDVNVDRVVVERIFVDQGIVLKRFLPRAQGRATTVRKRRSHLTVGLAEK